MDFDVTWTGVWVKLSHKEACTLTGGIPKKASAILKYLDLPGWVEKPLKAALPLASFAKELIADMVTINYRNGTSDNKGVKIFFNFWDREITKIHRRGKKRKSPCR